MNQNHLQTALPFAMNKANQKLQEQVQEPKPLVNLKRAIFDATKVGEPFDSAELIEALGKFGYKPGSIMNTLQTLVIEKKLTRSQKAPYAYGKLRSWEGEADTPLVIREVKPKTIKLEDMPRIPPIAAFRNNLAVMMAPVKPTTSFNIHDLDLVLHQLKGMKYVAQKYSFNRQQFHPEDHDLAISYGELANDLMVLIHGLEQTKKHLHQISQMAANLRTMS